MSNIVIGSLPLPGFNSNNLGADISLSGLTVTLSDDTVTGTFPARIVGLGGFKITLPGGVFDVESVESVSELTLTTPYTGSSGTVSATVHKFAQLRIYALSSFTPSGSSEVVQIGAPHSNNWFRRYAASVINDGEQNVLYLPEIVLPATTNSSNPVARYFVGIYGPSGQFIQQGPVNEFRLDSATTPTSWAIIAAFNSPPNPAPPQPANFYTQQQIDARFPTGLANQLLYFKNTGNVLHALTLDTAFTITGDTLFLAGPSGVNRIQEEGVNLPQRQTLNFVGTSFTAADDVGNARTNITADADLDALASNSTNGLWARTGAGTGSARTLQQPAAGLTITNPAGTAGDPTFALANDLAGVEGLATTGIAARTAANTWATRTLTQPAAGITITNPAGIAGDPTLVLANDLAAVEGLAANGAAFRTGADTWAVATGASTDGTNVTFGSTNLRATRPRVTTSIDDSSGNEVIETPATGSAVNQLRVTNSATGNPVQVSSVGDDTNIGQTALTKGTGDYVVNTNSIPRVTVAGADANLYVGDGITSATPDNYVINATGGSGTNIAGAHLDLAGGKGTGNAEPGQSAIRYPLRGASGTTLQSLSADRFPISTALYTNTSDGTPVANSTAETSLFTGVTASAGSTRIVEAGITKAGTAYRVFIYAGISTTGTPTLRIKVKAGTVLLADTGTSTMPTIAGGVVIIECIVNVQSIGAVGVTRSAFLATISNANSGVITPTFLAGATGAPTVDFTANQTIDVTAQWGTASASNSITFLSGLIERIR